MKPVDRRIFPRKELRTKVVFEDEFGGGLFYVYSTDLSMGGMLLESDIPLKIGSLIFISFFLPPHKRPLRVTAEVIRKHGEEGKARSGTGVRFVGLGEGAAKRLEEFLGDHS